MKLVDFVRFYRSLWPSCRDMGDLADDANATGYHELWREAVEVTPERDALAFLKSWRRAKPWPPTIEEFETGTFEQLRGRAGRAAVKGSAAARQWCERYMPAACENEPHGCPERWPTEAERDRSGHMASCRQGPEATPAEAAQQKAIRKAGLKMLQGFHRQGRPPVKAKTAAERAESMATMSEPDQVAILKALPPAEAAAVVEAMKARAL